MSAIADLLPLTETQSPADAQALAALVAEAHERGTAIYPLGGGTSLDYGLPATRQGIGISLAGLNRVIDYPARDMTITLEAGVTVETLASTLAAERQWLPIDLPQPTTATLGGAVATAWSGPHRYGYGTLRDYVIGISAVDGRGRPFKGGGRVVKNVAGYDFCKLLTGSLGALGIITQLTLKIRPLPQQSAFLVCDLRDLPSTERLLEALVNSETTPVAIELLAGPHWREHPSLGMLTAGTVARLAVGLEGTADEVQWMLSQLAREWNSLGATAPHMVCDERAMQLWHDLTEFSALPDGALVVKACLPPSHTIEFVELLRAIDPQVSITAHAGNGIVIARFADFDSGDVSRVLIGQLQPAASRSGGHLVVLSTSIAGLTRQATWGNPGAAAWMTKVAAQFDPKGLLNPGRCAFPTAEVAR